MKMRLNHFRVLNKNKLSVLGRKIRDKERGMMNKLTTELKSMEKSDLQSSKFNGIKERVLSDESLSLDTPDDDRSFF